MTPTDNIPLTIRIPADLHFEAKEAAARDGRSLSNWIVKAIRIQLHNDTRGPWDTDHYKEMARKRGKLTRKEGK